MTSRSPFGAPARYLDESKTLRDWAPATHNRAREALHDMYEFAIRIHEFVSPDPRYPNPVKAVPRKKLPAPNIKFLHMEDISLQLEALTRYDPSSNSWVPMAPLQVRRSTAGSAVVASNIYVIGGYDGVDYLASMESATISNGQVGAYSRGPSIAVDSSNTVHSEHFRQNALYGRSDFLHLAEIYGMNMARAGRLLGHFQSREDDDILVLLALAWKQGDPGALLDAPPARHASLRKRRSFTQQ